MGISIDRDRAAALGINVVPSFSHRYGDPVPFPHEDIVAICVGCGRGLTADDVVIECQCWSGIVSASIPCAMCGTCWEEAKGELV